MRWWRRFGILSKGVDLGWYKSASAITECEDRCESSFVVAQTNRMPSWTRLRSELKDFAYSSSCRRPRHELRP
jgi:hypothetical protein